MAVIVEKICQGCNKVFSGKLNSENSFCMDCVQLVDEESKQKYFAVMENLSIEERIKRLEEIVYNLSKPLPTSKNHY
ncbi:MAG: hypothetical protein KAS32_09395 [Candidatus Peribacteraceae bacterium]|nr:hypothetical protein [Candidatus Peribacteraceae bacterium]